MATAPRVLELLAPARDAATAMAAINHGADAVYMGAPAFGARAAATNSVDDIAAVAEYAHRFGARVYVTVNTIVYEHELKEVEALVRSLWRAGADALIVQDMALLQLDLPPIELHASTQTDARSPEKVEMLARAGFSQIVVPREFSLDEIAAASGAAATVGAKIETFVHGALCVSYSGDCHAGAVLAGRSANRGECPQICRLSFTLTDRTGRPVDVPDGQPSTRHWLSLADMNRIDSLAAMAEAGVSSFKIEGRLKNVSYVKNVVSAYSKALDEVVASSDGRYRRSSFGRTDYNFIPSLAGAFNRGFTGYFLTGKDADIRQITSWKTPKWTGIAVGTVASANGSRIGLRLDDNVVLANGDGLGYFNSKGGFDGVRVNRVEGSTIFLPPGSAPHIKPGTKIYRNSDSVRENLLSRSDTANRSIGVNIVLRRLSEGRIVADAHDERGGKASVASVNAFSDIARGDASASRADIFGRLGNTVYRLESLDDRVGDVFIPAKELTDLRRRLMAALDADFALVRAVGRRSQSTLPSDAFAGMKFDYHANVANRLARRFYAAHGAETVDEALETSMASGEKRIMTTRYCLRRSLGCCLKTSDGNRLPDKLFLDAPIGRLRLEFDCRNCNMKIYANPKYIPNGKN